MQKIMCNCKHLKIKHPAEGSPIGKCDINYNSHKEAPVMKDVYEKKYPSYIYVMNGECMFFRPNCKISDCPYS